MISIVVPVLNEEKTIEGLLMQIKALRGEKEIIVVDGGSSDNTIDIASKYAAVYKSRPGRACQMNLGAKMSIGSILWFVHSDSRVNNNSLYEINKALKEGHIGGGFSLKFYDLDTSFMKFVSKTSNIRAKKIGLYFGDQGIFVRKDIFESLGGYPEIPIMEDWEFGLKLKKTGKMKLLETEIASSARRFKMGGQFKTLMLMHKIKFLYLIGVSPDRLINIYREAR